MESALDHRGARALLEWYIDLGADECIQDSPVDRYTLPEVQGYAGVKAPVAAAPAAARGAPPPIPVMAKVDAVAEAAAAAGAAADLPALRAAMEAFPHCDLKRGARNLVFSDGLPGARVMIIGEAPGREEDQEGRPFVGSAGQLLDRMLAAIGLSRSASEADAAVYITNVLPWRPPQNRDPSADEVAMMLPFLFRHIELADPDVIVVMGNASTRAVLATPSGITRLRGNWTEWRGRPVLPMFHPAALLRNGELKKPAWADLLALRVRLDEGGAHD